MIYFLPKKILLTSFLFLWTLYAQCQCSISIQSSGTTICDNNIGIYAAFSGSNFQWYRNGNPIPAPLGTSSTMTLTSGQGGTYWLVAKPSTCTYQVQSNTIIITDNSPLGVSVYPSGNPTICKGSNVQLNVTSVPGYTYQWTKNGSVINGANSTTYFASESGNYECVVRNGSCVKQFGAIPVTVINPIISPSSVPMLCSPGQTVTFSIEANPMYSAYQWRRDGVIISGATSSSYTASSPGGYTVSVTYTNCTSTSDPKFINPLPTPTVNAGADKTVSASDIITLNGTGSHPICSLGYSWTKISGPGVSISGANTSTLSLSNFVGGSNYVFRLTGYINGASANDDVSITVEKTQLQMDSLVLVELYQKMDGVHWSNKSGWLTAPIRQWSGVGVSGNRVTFLDLSARDLKGSVPNSIGNLTALKELDLPYNQISAVPNTINNCTELIFLSLNDNFLTYLPTYNNLTKLQRFEIGNNQINSQIPVWIFNSKGLRTLNLGSNQFFGAISENFKELAELRELYLNNNKLSGSTPICFGSMPKLVAIDLYDNKLTGLGPVIPENLYYLQVSNNRLDYGDFETLFANGYPPFLGEFGYWGQEGIQLTFNSKTRTLGVRDVGGTNNTYQWKRNGVNIPEAIYPTLALSLTEYLANEEYSCYIYNPTLEMVLWTYPKHPQGQFPVQGDFLSKASGNWNNYKIWQTFDGQYYNDAYVDELPNVNTPVYIEKGHSVFLTETSSCKDLNLSADADTVRLNTNENILEVWGKLRLYSQTVPNINGGTSVGIPGWIRTGTNGRIRLRGNASRVVTEQGEFSNHINMKGWTLDCMLNDGVIGTINSNFRANDIIIVSGNIEVKSLSFKLGK